MFTFILGTDNLHAFFCVLFFCLSATKNRFRNDECGGTLKFQSLLLNIKSKIKGKWPDRQTAHDRNRTRRAMRLLTRPAGIACNIKVVGGAGGGRVRSKTVKSMFFSCDLLLRYVASFSSGERERRQNEEAADGEDVRQTVAADTS